MPLTITLKKPIKRGDSELKEVTVRDVESSDYIALGPIFEMRFDKGVQQMHEDPQKALAYIVRLGGLTEREVRSLALGDFFRLKGFIQSQLFFPDGSAGSEESLS